MELSLIEQTPHFACLNGDIELYKNYTQKNFEEILESSFNIIKKININNSKRVLYYVEIKQNA